MKILDKTTQTYKELVLKPGGDTLPIGSIVAFASDTIPNGWLLCDGSVVSRTTYSELFNAIGLNYVEDGVEWLDEERFPLPNPKGRTLVGKDSTDTDFNTLGKTSGEKTHRHEFTIGQLYSYGVPIGDGFDNAGAYKDSTSNFAGTTGTITAKTTNKNTAIANSMDTNIEAGGKSSTGDTTLSSNLQPSLTLNYIIKAKNTVVVKGDVIQENGTASENNTYSAKAIDNKLKTNIVIGQEVATNEYEGGKQVFIKEIYISSLPNATRKIVETGLTNVKVTKIHGIARDSSIQIPLPFAYPELPSCIGIMFVNGSLYINTGSDRTKFTGEITISYTKNT